MSLYGEQERAALMANALPSSVLVDMVQQAGFAERANPSHYQFWRWFPDLKGQLYMVRARKSRQGGIES